MLRYIGVDEKDDVQLFYYFIPSEGNPQDDPLLLWLIGGHGCSALSGLVYEIGPLRFNKTRYDGRLPSLMLNPYSWTKVSSIIFLDAPIGTGFSYSASAEGYDTGDKVHAHQSRIFLEKWLLSHPSFMKMMYMSPATLIQGYLLGNPVTDSVFDQGSRIPFDYHKALIPKELYESAKRNCRGEYVRFNRTHLECADDLQAMSECTSGVNKGHILEPKCDIYKPSHKLLENRRYMAEIYEDTWRGATRNSGIPLSEQEYFDLLCGVWANDPAVQKGLHVRQGILRSWVRCNRSLAYAYNVRGTVSHHLYLNSRGCCALIYSGDHDMVMPYLGTQSWIKSLNLSIVEDWRPWMVGDQVAGFTREYSNGFTFAMVKGGGHTAPEYLPEECFAMYKRWIYQQPLTHCS